MSIQLITFGGLRAVNGAGELQRLLAQHSRAALFVYLAVDRHAPRELLTTIFWPESDAENARHALRQSLYQLRKVLGGEWIDSRAHELVVSDEVETDAHAFTHALERGDLENAVRLYQGPFLDGVYLVDQRPWESWVDSRRAQYARAFRKACRDLLDTKRVAGDLAGAVQVAERWVAQDPSDDEAQHRLIEALAAAGERADAIRQYETYARRVEPDGLQPLDETQRLVDRLRTDSAPLPALRGVPVPIPVRSPEPFNTSAQLPEPITSPATSPEPFNTPVRLPELITPAVEARESPAVARRARRPVVWVLAVLVVSVWVFIRMWGSFSPAPSATTIAVLPFSVRGGETVQYLGEGLVNLLGAALNGAGSLRPVDTRATFAAVAVAGSNMIDAQQADGVALRLGAGMFVLGDVVEAGNTLHIEGAVYDVGADCARSFWRSSSATRCAPTVLARAAVSGAADSVFALVDRLAARLLGGLGDPAADRLLRTAALTTNHLPAFKTYLRGEELMRDGQFERAAEDYLAAIAIDSTFALAHYRLALAREWAPLPGNEDAASAAGRHGARLSTRDRDLLDAFRLWRGGDALQAGRAYRAILARYPDDVDAWFQLGEIQFHHGPLVGQALEQSEEAWRKVLSFESQNLFAITHLARIAVVARHPATLDSLLQQFGAEELHKDRRLYELAILQAVAQGDTAAARTLAVHVRRGESFSVWRVAAFLTAFSPDPAGMLAVVRELNIDFPNAALSADLRWFASVLELSGGRAHAARLTLAEAAEAEQLVAASERRWGFAEATEWFAATLPLPYADSTIARGRQRAAANVATVAPSRAAFLGVLGMGLPIQIEPLRQYTLGTLSLRLADTASAAIAAATLEQLAASSNATVLVRDLDRGLRARLTLQRGRPEEALRLLEAIEARDWQGDIAATPFASRVHERFLRGEVLIALKRDADALPWFASIGQGAVTEIPLQAPSHLRRAEIYERLGNRDEAVKHYTRFLELWRNADAEFEPLVRAARARLAKLAKSR